MPKVKAQKWQINIHINEEEKNAEKNRILETNINGVTVLSEMDIF